ncbi:MAG: hypothetical protein WC428_02145 [Candidatus Paceibacterota bacterium]
MAKIKETISTPTTTRKMLKNKIKEGLEECCDYGIKKEFTNEVLNELIKPLVAHLEILGINVK